LGRDQSWWPVIHFASAKFGLHAVAQNTARELGPKNTHVAHLVIDAAVDTAWVRERIKERVGALANLDPGRLMRPASGRRGLLADLSGAARRLILRPLAGLRQYWIERWEWAKE
jgi:NAD(P)-dependent dehydrogenase (short-subunit alcohol dehydrogenase family)